MRLTCPLGRAAHGHSSPAPRCFGKGKTPGPERPWGGGEASGEGRFSISTAVAAAGPHIRSDVRHSRHMALRVNTP